MTHFAFLRMFRWLKHFGPATARQCGEGLGIKLHDISTRMSYLAELGLVEALGGRKPVSFRLSVIGQGVYESLQRREEARKALGEGSNSPSPRAPGPPGLR